MKRRRTHIGRLCHILVFIATIISLDSASAIPIIETATFEPLPEVGHELGSSLARDQWLGMRFMTTGLTQVTHVGGYLGSGGRASDPSYNILQFAAIVSLDDRGLPMTTDLQNDAHFFTLFDVPSRGSGGVLGEDITIETNVVLEEGLYGLVFGHNLDWGCTGTGGYMPSTGTRIDEPSFFISRTLDHIWETFPLSNFSDDKAWRFTIEGNPLDLGGGLKQFEGELHEPAPVPEPATIILLGTGLLGLGAFRKKFRK